MFLIKGDTRGRATVSCQVPEFDLIYQLLLYRLASPFKHTVSNASRKMR